MVRVGLLSTLTHFCQLYKLLPLSFFLQNTPIIQADSRNPVKKMIERLSVCVLMLMTCATVRCEKFKMLEGVMMTSSDYQTTDSTAPDVYYVYIDV